MARAKQHPDRLLALSTPVPQALGSIQMALAEHVLFVIRLLWRRRARALFVALLITLVSFCGAPCAWADDPANDPEDNQVYVNQLPDSSFLYETSIADLAQADSFLDGQVVLVQGEVVGDRINDELQEGHCWITLQDINSDNPSVVSVVMGDDKTSLIDTYGAYGKTGTTLRVRGIFHLQCNTHQGMSDIHVDEVSAVAPGATHDIPVDTRLLALAVISILAGLGLMGLYYIRRERLR